MRPVMSPLRHVAASAILALCATASAAPPDAPNAKDHPILTRYPGSHIVEYEKNFNALEFAVGTEAGEPKRRSVEGDATVIRYFHNDAAKQPSALQIIRNYQGAIKSIGGEVVYERLPPVVALSVVSPPIDLMAPW